MKVIRVPVSSLRPKVLARREFGDLSRLAESIKEHGVLEPLIVSETGEGCYEIVLGVRRYLAALKAGVSDLPAIPINRVSLIEAIEIIFKDDDLKKKLTVDERCLIIAALVEKHGIRETARRLCIPASTVETLAKAGKTFAGVLTILSVRSSDKPKIQDVKFKVKVKLAEKVYEAVKKAGYDGKEFKETAGRAYLGLVNFTTDVALSILKEWTENPTLEYLKKLIESYSQDGTISKIRFRIPRLDERVPVELEEGKPFENILVEASQQHLTPYDAVEEESVKIIEFKEKYSGISGLLCPRCNRPLRCRVCGSIVNCICAYPHGPVRRRKYKYAVKEGGSYEECRKPC
ncbi:MAG: ParB N-terminal domain-containing protein [Nitrososphaeria archaeon]|nr:ParB N-terminal domain-containing protein [Nitrososphaeria archaeon]